MKLQLDHTRDSLLSNQAKELLRDYYMDPDESFQEALARPAIFFSQGDQDFAQRIYDSVSQLHWMYSSPILSNAGRSGMPISCFLSYVPDSVQGQIDISSEIAGLSVAGGGVGLHNGVRAISDKAPGPIPFMKTIDASMGYYRQGKTRRGSSAYYMDVDHPCILEHIRFRVPTGGDSARKADNRKSFHHAVNISKAFGQAVDNDTDWGLKCPATGETREVVKAREVWELILETRELTGEPYINFIDVANEGLPQYQKDLGLKVHGSNLCNEIHLATNEERTAVCCLSSLNLEKYDEWSSTGLVGDLVRFLDNVLDYFIREAPDSLSKAKYSAARERSIGIGAMGFHSYLQSKGIAWETGGFNSAVQHNHNIFDNIKGQAVGATRALAVEKGEAPDAEGYGVRNTHLLAIAPNANSSVLCGCSASIEPVAANVYTHTTRGGTYEVRNKYLEELLEAKGMNTPEIWRSISKSFGSVQHLEFLSEDDCKLFKTFNEIDQHWVVQHAEDRQQYICMGQSVNLSFLPGSDRAYINSVHLKAMRGGKLKGLYYFRTDSKQKADVAVAMQRVALVDWSDTGECVACHG